MNDINNNLNNQTQEKPHKMQQDINELQTKYNDLNKEVQQLESNRTALNSEIKQIHGEFEQINKSIEGILQKLSNLPDACIGIGTETDEMDTKTYSIKNFFTKPIRKIAVGTLSTVYAVVDKTIEKTSSFKENLEDIVAEAQYVNKKKRTPPVESS